MNYNYQQPFIPQNQQQRYYWQNPPMPVVRPVSSLDEVKASPIDFDGSVFYFPDLANRRIYTKQIQMDGTAAINMYELKEIPKAGNPTGDYITREEVEAVINSLRSAPVGQPASAPVFYGGQIMYPVNPMQIIQMIKGGSNPQQLLMSILQGNMGNTPMGQNLMTLVQNGDKQGLEKIARNLCQQKGVNFDQEFNAFKQMLGY